MMIPTRESAPGGDESHFWRYIPLLEDMHEVVCLVSGDGLPHFINASFRNVFGYASLTELLHHGGLEAICPGYGVSLASQALRGNQGWSGSVSLRHRSGQPMRATLRVRPLPIQAGEVMAAAFLFQDLAHQPQALAFSRLLESFVENAPEAVMISKGEPADEAGSRITYVNSAFCRLTGYQPPEVVGRNPQFLQGPLTDQGELDRIQEAINARRAIQCELIYYRKNEQTFWAELSLIPVSDPLRDQPHFVFVQRDTTGQKRIRQALLESQQHYQSLFEYHPDAVFSLDLDGRVLCGNPAFARLVEAPLAELQQRHFLTFVETADQEKAMNFFQQACQGQSSNYDVGAVSTKGNRLVVNCTKLPIIVNGHLTGVFNIIKDITLRHQAEETLQQYTAHVEKVNQELDHFVYRTSHDLRAPLVSILGLIQLTQQESQEQTKNEYLKLMAKSVHKLDNFIQSIIHYSKNSRTDLTLSEVNLEVLVRETLEDLQFMEEARTMAFRTRFEVTAGFHTDADRLGVILHNLVSNAIRYQDPAKPETYLSIRAEKTDEGAVQITVEDNGQGIALVHQPRIFEMFYRASQRSGSGLGLYIVQENLQKLKGTIRVVSQVGQGTAFILYLPNLAGHSTAS
jgi:PAS domain S-box-containing protein